MYSSIETPFVERELNVIREVFVLAVCHLSVTWLIRAAYSVRAGSLMFVKIGCAQGCNHFVSSAWLLHGLVTKPHSLDLIVDEHMYLLGLIIMSCNQVNCFINEYFQPY